MSAMEIVKSEGASPVTGWCKAYHPSGFLVTLPVPVTGPNPTDNTLGGAYRLAFSAVGEILAAGFLVTAPGLEEGEQKETCGYVVRRSKDDGTPIIDLYLNQDALRTPLLSHYLNNAELLGEFEAASGLRVDRLQKYIGDNKIERGKKKETDDLVYKLARPVGFVYKKNPAYSEEEAKALAATGKNYFVPKRKFVRWADAPAPGADKTIQTSPHTQNVATPDTQNQDKVADELPTVERLCGWYKQSTVAQLGRLEEYRKRLFFGSTDSEKVAMTAASDACKQRLGLVGGGPEKAMGSHDGYSRIPF